MKIFWRSTSNMLKLIISNLSQPTDSALSSRSLVINADSDSLDSILAAVRNMMKTFSGRFSLNCFSHFLLHNDNSAASWKQTLELDEDDAIKFRRQNWTEK